MIINKLRIQIYPLKIQCRRQILRAKASRSSVQTRSPQKRVPSGHTGRCEAAWRIVQGGASQRPILGLTSRTASASSSDACQIYSCAFQQSRIECLCQRFRRSADSVKRIATALGSRYSANSAGAPAARTAATSSHVRSMLSS